MYGARSDLIGKGLGLDGVMFNMTYWNQRFDRGRREKHTLRRVDWEDDVYASLNATQYENDSSISS
jgi:hypothetical protein